MYENMDNAALCIDIDAEYALMEVSEDDVTPTLRYVSHAEYRATDALLALVSA